MRKHYKHTQEYLKRKGKLKKFEYGDPCPGCGLSWNHGAVSCEYQYPEEPTHSKAKIEELKVSDDVRELAKYNGKATEIVLIDKLNELIRYINSNSI